MDITGFVVSQRERALLVGDYGSYRKQLSRRLLVVRRKLNYTSPKGRKYSAKAPITAEDIANNHEYASLLRSAADTDLLSQVCTLALAHIRARLGTGNAYEINALCRRSQEYHWIYEAPYLLSPSQS